MGFFKKLYAEVNNSPALMIIINISITAIFIKASYVYSYNKNALTAYSIFAVLGIFFIGESIIKYRRKYLKKYEDM